MFVHFVDGDMQNLPQIHLSKLLGHLFAKDPCGDRRAFNNLSFQQFINDNAHHLLVVVPQIKYIVEHTNLTLLGFSELLEHIMILYYCRKSVCKTLGTEIQQCLHKHVNL